MRTANPAVQAQQRDPVLTAVQDPLARAGQPERQPGERAGVAQRRRRRQGVAVLRLDQPGRAGAQAGERAEEPGVAEERRGLQVLLGQEGRGRRGRTRRDGLQRPPFGGGQAVARGGQLLEQPEQRGPQERQPGVVRPGGRGERGRVGVAHGGPGRDRGGQRVLAGGHPTRPERLELVRGQLAEAAEAGPAGKRVHHDELRGAYRGDQRQRVRQLKLVVQVVLEPQHYLLPVLQRLDQLPVPILQRGQDRPPAPPAARGEERRAGLEQLAPRSGWHRPLVQHVLPGQHRAAQRGLAQRVPGAVAVGDVQGRGVDAGPPRGLSRSHVSTINPYPGAGINQDGQAGGAGGRAAATLTLPH